MTSDPNAKRLLWFVFTGSRGGLNRLKIISILKENPLNINQLAKELSLDYKAIQHHIKVLEKNNLITNHPIIVASNSNTSDPHYFPTGNRSRKIKE